MFTFSECNQCKETPRSECYKCDYNPYHMCTYSVCDHVIETTIKCNNINKHIEKKKTEQQLYVNMSNVTLVLPIPDTNFYIVIWEFLYDGEHISYIYEFIDTENDIIITEKDIYEEYRQKKCFYPNFTDKINVIIFEKKVYIYDTQYIFVYENMKLQKFIQAPLKKGIMRKIKEVVFVKDVLHVICDNLRTYIYNDDGSSYTYTYTYTVIDEKEQDDEYYLNISVKKQFLYYVHKDNLFNKYYAWECEGKTFISGLHEYDSYRKYSISL